MKKTIAALAIALLCSVHAFPQAEKFDIISFVAPQGWHRADTNGIISFIDSKNINGLSSFCQIILYPSGKSTGDVTRDFKTAWNNLVTTPTKSKARPVTQIEKTPDGWTITTGSANITTKGITYKSIVITVTGFRKTINIQVNLVGNEHNTAIEKFFNDLQFENKTAIIDNKQQTKGSHNSQVASREPFALSDYDFITPDQWQLQRNKDHLSIQNPGGSCSIKILAPQLSSGDLERDANVVFDLMYTGWTYQKSGSQKYIVSKGFLPKGLEYFRKEANMSMTDASGRYNFEEGIAMVVKAGTQIVIISVRHNSSMMAHDECRLKYSTWKRFINSFTVKNTAFTAKADEEIGPRIIGLWKTAENMVISDYIFAANGKYQHGGAMGSSSTSTDFNYEYIHYKSYSWEGDGSYTIDGNRLILRKRGENTPRSVQVRFEKVNHGNTGWKDRMYMLTTDVAGENEACFEKQE